jgi:hypothetical protein
MASNTTPTYTAAAAGNVIASASLAASATTNSSTAMDFSAAFQGQIHVLNTPGGSIAATRGLKIEIFRRYGTTPTTAQTAMYTYTLPSTTASTAESVDIFLDTGVYNIKLTNLDASNAITVEVTSDKISALATA